LISLVFEDCVKITTITLVKPINKLNHPRIPKNLKRFRDYLEVGKTAEPSRKKK